MSDIKRTAALAAFDPTGEHESERGLFEGVKESAGELIDLFTGVDQSDVGKGKINTDDLPRADKIELLIDGQTSGFFSSSPWSVGAELDKSVADEIHTNKGATLVFKVSADFVDAIEAKARAVRYALVWDDSIKSETGTLDVSVLGSTFLVVVVNDEPTGQKLTLWITDDDVKVSLVRQGTKQQAQEIRDAIVGDLSDLGKQAGNKDSGDENPVTGALKGAFNAVTGFITTSQIGGIVALAVVGVVLVLVVRSEGFKDAAKAAAKVV